MAKDRTFRSAGFIIQFRDQKTIDGSSASCPSVGGVNLVNVHLFRRRPCRSAAPDPPGSATIYRNMAFDALTHAKSMLISPRSWRSNTYRLHRRKDGPLHQGLSIEASMAWHVEIVAVLQFFRCVMPQSTCWSLVHRGFSALHCLRTYIFGSLAVRGSACRCR